MITLGPSLTGIRGTQVMGSIIYTLVTTQSGGVSTNVHQVCVIITEATEENDDTNNIVVNT
jgi:hypothetical protein